MRKPYKGEPDEVCPYLDKLCVEACPTCRMQQQYMGVNVNTGEPVPFWECAIVMHTLIAMEASRNTYGVARAVESFHSETVEQNKALIHGTVKIAERAIEGAQEVARLTAPIE